MKTFENFVHSEDLHCDHVSDAINRNCVCKGVNQMVHSARITKE